MVSLLMTTFAAHGQDGIQVDFPEMNPVVLGDGWDIDKAQKKFKSCISFTTKSDIYNSTKLSYEQAIDNESLARSLDVSASASFKELTGGGFSATASFAQSLSFSSTSTYMSALAEVWVSPTYLNPGTVTLKPEMLEIASKNPAEFYKQCGTGFISVLQRGAKLVALLDFKGTTQEEKQEIAATASYSGVSGGFDMSADSKMKKFQSSNRFSIQATRSGGDGKTISLSMDELNQEIKNLPAQAATAPITFRMFIEPYSSVPGWPTAPLSVDLTDHQALSQAYGRLLTIWSYADEALKSRGGWLLKYDAKKDMINVLKGEAQKGLDDIKTRARNCATQDKCEVGEWRTWTDLEMRSRLPYRGAFSDLGLNDSNIDQLPNVLAQKRIEQWIADIDTIRCKRYGECTPTAVYQQIENALKARIAKSVPF